MYQCILNKDKVKKVIKIVGISVMFFLLSRTSYAQVEISGDDTPAPSAELHVKENTLVPKGVLFPSMNTVQMRAIVNPANGLIVYNTDYKRYMYYVTYNNGTPFNSWVCMGGMQVANERVDLEPLSGVGLSQGIMSYEASTGKALYYNGSGWTELCITANTITPTVNNP